MDRPLRPHLLPAVPDPHLRRWSGGLIPETQDRHFPRAGSDREPVGSMTLRDNLISEMHLQEVSHGTGLRDT